MTNDEAAELAQLREEEASAKQSGMCCACYMSGPFPELQMLRARIAEQDAELAELRAFRDRMRDAPKRLADAMRCGHAYESPSCESCCTANDIREGRFDKAIFGEGGKL